MSEQLQHEALVRTIVHKFENTGLEPDDLFQEGMLALWKAEHTFDPQLGIKFETYASVVINNRLIDLVRKEKRKPGKDPHPPEDLPGNGSGGFVLGEILEILKQVLTDCTPTERAIFNAYLGGSSYEEICHQCAVNKKKVDNTIQKIKKMVKLSDED